MKQKKNYWLIEKPAKDGHLDQTLCITDQWQVRPDGAVELTKEEYLIWQERFTKRNDPN